MPSLFWDASGLTKRYTLELGSEVVNALFLAPEINRHVTRLWNFAETFSILVRKRNRGDISAREYSDSESSLHWEMLDGPSSSFLQIEDDDILAGLRLIAEHNLNAADASVLAMLIRLAAESPPSDEALRLVASDRRLLRTAQAEGLPTLDPESLTIGEALALIGHP